MLPLPQPHQSHDGLLIGHILHIDTFGNLTTNIKKDNLPQAGEEITIIVGNQRIQRLNNTYADGKGLLALIGSSGYLEIAVNGGSACALLDAKLGDGLTIRRHQSGSK
ncbi:SAM hydroxide adenosyltransferase [Chloroflexota bacterium]